MTTSWLPRDEAGHVALHVVEETARRVSTIMFHIDDVAELELPAQLSEVTVAVVAGYARSSSILTGRAPRSHKPSRNARGELLSTPLVGDRPL